MWSAFSVRIYIEMVSAKASSRLESLHIVTWSQAALLDRPIAGKIQREGWGLGV